MVPASSAYESAENSAVSPAITKDTTTAGPASGTASPRTTKMPVPSVAPMLIMVSCQTPMERRRLPPSPWPPSATSRSTGLRRISRAPSPPAGGLPSGRWAVGGAAPCSNTWVAP